MQRQHILSPESNYLQTIPSEDPSILGPLLRDMDPTKSHWYAAALKGCHPRFLQH